MNARLLYVLNDLENFKVREAAEKLEDLVRYDIPEAINQACVDARQRLEEFDDGAAEELIQNALMELQKHPL